MLFSHMQTPVNTATSRAQIPQVNVDLFPGIGYLELAAAKLLAVTMFQI